ncbi:hypothetical protein MMC06_002660 [Schaereria dolodes]|nr:hypothetical protein [Schaereria dolodes]
MPNQETTISPPPVMFTGHLNELPSLPQKPPGKLTRQQEQDDPIHHQNGPEHRYVEDFKPRTREPQGNSPRRRVPELKFRQASDERTELLILFGREAYARVAVF